MTKSTLIWIICAVFLLLLGGIIFAGAMTALKWNFNKLSTSELKTSEYNINEKYDSICINTNTADVIFLPSEDDTTRVICSEYENEAHTVSVTDKTLNITLNDTRKWYEHINIISEPEIIKIYLPYAEYKSLSINASTSDIEIPDFTALEGIQITLSTGDVDIEDVKADLLDVKITTGDITVTGAEIENDVSVNVTTGEIRISGTTCKSLFSNGTTGDITLKNTILNGNLEIKRSTGDVTLDGCDASEIYVKSSTGDVKGSLLSDKIFSTNTSTGSVDVPESITGGKCKITTTTGDIKVTVKIPAP